MGITKEQFDEYVQKSIFTERNFSARYSPATLSSNMIPCNVLEEFHYQVLFFLNFFSALLLEIDKKNETDLYNINKLTEIYNTLNINFDTTTTYGAGSGQISVLSSTILTGTPAVPPIFTFYVNTFLNFSNATDFSSNYNKYSLYSNYEKYKPKFHSNLDNLTTTVGFKNYLLSNMINTNITNSNINSILSSNTSKLPFYINEFFNQGIVNFKGYLIDKKIQLNTVLFNINIQNKIITDYLHNITPLDVEPSGEGVTPAILSQVGNNLGKSLTSSASSITLNTYNVSNIKAYIETNTSNIDELSSSMFPNIQENYLLEKNKYVNKITFLNNLKNEFIKTQDKLNLSLKLYNQQLKNYNKIKYYATFVIIALIIVIILIIGLSVFPIFSKDTLNAIYIVLLIVQIVLTFLYYSKFKYVNLYEKFYLTTPTCSAHADSPIASYSSTNNRHRINHAKIYELLNQPMTSYLTSINTINDRLRMNIYTIDSQSFSQDANKYLYNMYLEKKRSVEVNKTKLINYFNMIEVIKKQINYLFNVIFSISCFFIIILLGLVMYSSVPQLYIFIIVLCVILIIILMIYFTFTVIQPTRMIVNKNYWANENPSSTSIARL